MPGALAGCLMVAPVLFPARRSTNTAEGIFDPSGGTSLIAALPVQDNGTAMTDGMCGVVLKQTPARRYRLPQI